MKAADYFDRSDRHLVKIGCYDKGSTDHNQSVLGPSSPVKVVTQWRPTLQNLENILALNQP